MALDRANSQLFIPAYGNGGFRAFKLNEQGLPQDRRARFVTSRESLYGRRSVPLPNGREATFPGAAALIDSANDRFFAVDRFANRILVYNAKRGRLKEFPPADIVIGQPDATSVTRGLGPNRMGAIASAELDEEHQRLFVVDSPNNRVLVFDVHPERLRNDPGAVDVIGQDDLSESRDAGIGPDGLTRPSSVAYDPVLKRLFVSDVGNNRVLIFDADPKNPAALDRAIAVMGQPDFMSRAPRQSLDEFKAEAIAYDWRHQRLFVSEDLEHRVMVYDAHPDRVGGPAKAMAVIGQPDAFSTRPEVSDTRLAMPRVTVDSESQKLYVSEGYPAGNRISIWDISPENLRTGMAAIDVIGQETPQGDPDFFNRMAQGHLDGRSLAAARAVTLDPRNHRLFAADQYNHRVVVWQLDALNRVVDYDARWALGQPDLNSSLMGAPTARNMTVPIGMAYDSSTDRLFVGDGYHNRILMYDVAPGEIESGMAASIVLGQPDFQTVTYGAGTDGINFGVRMGRGIASDFLPMGFAVDESGQRLFVSDGENNRVLIYDIRPNQLSNGASATGVLGQTDFVSTRARTGRAGLQDPGHLAYDPTTQRLFVIDGGRERVLAFDVDPERFVNGAPAMAVLGRTDFETPPDRGPRRGPMLGGARRAPAVDGRSFVSPNGIALDSVQQLLYVSDGGGTFGVPADRILAFDVHPQRLRNGAAAVETLGAPSAEATTPASWGGVEPIPGQFRVRDTRGIALDQENGRLFVTGSFASRLVQFNFPRALWPFQIEPERAQAFATLDAADAGGRSDPFTVAAARVQPTSGTAPLGVAVYSVSAPFVDERSQRHSRRLIAEAALPAATPTRAATVLVDGAENRRHSVFLYNPGSREVDLSLALRGEDGSDVAAWQVSIGAGAQHEVTLESSFGSVPAEAALTVQAETPFTLAAMRLTTNARGEEVVSPAPVAYANSTDPGASVVPYFVNGDGYRSELVLINPTDTPSTGSVTFHGSKGDVKALGTPSDIVDYEVVPYGSVSIRAEGAGPVRQLGYARIETNEGPRPTAVALVSKGHGASWMNEFLVAAAAGRDADFSIDLNPTMIRQGTIDTEIIAVNPPAGRDDVRLQIALNGEPSEAGQLAPGEQAILSLRSLFGAEARGVATVSVSGNRPIAVAARQVVVNVEGERIESTLPPVHPGGVFPFVPNGSGVSTEFRLVNETSGEARGRLAFFSPNGELARDTILR